MLKKLAMFAVLTVAAVGVLPGHQTPASAPKHRVAKADSGHGGSNQQKPQGTDQTAPSAVASPTQNPSSPTCDETCQQGRQNIAIQRRLEWFTGGLVFVGLLQAMVMGLQAILLRKTRDDVHTQAGWMKAQAGTMERQTGILEKSVAAAQKSADAALAQIELVKSKERARITLQPLPLAYFEEMATWQKMEFAISNFGVTPALRIRIVVKCWLHGQSGSSVLPEGAEVLPDHLKGGHNDVIWVSVVKPTENVKVEVPLFWYPDAASAKRIKNVFINVSGRADYDDIFGESHFFPYHFSFFLNELGKPCEGLDGVRRMAITSVPKWIGNQGEDGEDRAN